MIIGIQDELLQINSLGLLDRLLEDRTTKAHILWATDAYTDLGPDYQRDREIRAELITGERSGVIKNRARKALEQQSARTRQHAEVFTPNWVCAKMCDYADEMWFGRSDRFFKDGEPTDRVEFPKRKSWKRYVDERRMEITCGEAPFLVSRYDVSNGESIPLARRTGILDRKLRVVGENAETEEEWLQWAMRALQANYGYEFQGDNLLISRVNLLMTFEEYLSSRWERKPTRQEYETAVNIIVWNLWQMDGLTYTIPYRKAEEEGFQFDFFEEMGFPAEEEKTQPYCRICDWRKKTSFEFQELKREKGKMKLCYIIGNPPYQEETESDSTRMPPIYHHFMEEAFGIADKVELITPARFLFNAGYTPKSWNEKMLNDPHFAVTYYEADSSKIFPNTDIKGGVCISYRDKSKDFGAIVTFTKFDELNHILKKVKKQTTQYLSQIISSPLNFQLSDLAKKEHPELVDRLRSSAFSNLAPIFFEVPPADEHSYVGMIGLLSGKRTKRYIRREYIREISDTLDKYTLLLSKANGAGQFGEILSEPEVAEPGVGYTQTFIAVGSFRTEQEAQNVGKYIHTKFARTMLGILKITQDCPGPKWAYVPLQDFTPASDIDWSKSIPEIDRQLYAKYGLDEAEIAFIESHVKEMS